MKTFLLIVLGQIISLFGNAALRFALPLYLLRQTGSATLYGMVTAAAMLPALLGTLAGGVLADRFPKAKIMAALDGIATLVSIFAACTTGYLPAAILVLFALGTLYALQGLYQPAVRASLPLLLDGSRLLQANAIIQLIDTLDELFGPLLASVLMGVCGFRSLLVLCAICFALSAGMECLIQIPNDGCRPLQGGLHSLWTDFSKGLHRLTQMPSILFLAVVMAGVNFLVIPALTVGVPFLVVQYLGLSDTALGVTQVFLSAGGLAGGALAGCAGKHFSGTKPLFFIAWMLVVCGVFCLDLSCTYWGITLCGGSIMAAAALFNVWFFSHLQQLVPQEQLGRVTSCVIVFATLTQPLGQALYGWCFGQFSAQPAVILIGCGLFSVLLLAGAKRLSPHSV